METSLYLKQCCWYLPCKFKGDGECMQNCGVTYHVSNTNLEHAQPLRLRWTQYEIHGSYLSDLTRVFFCFILRTLTKASRRRLSKLANLLILLLSPSSLSPISNLIWHVPEIHGSGDSCLRTRVNITRDPISLYL